MGVQGDYRCEDCMKRVREYTGVMGMVPRRMIKFNKRLTQILCVRLLPTKSTKYIVEPLL